MSRPRHFGSETAVDGRELGRELGFDYCEVYVPLFLRRFNRTALRKSISSLFSFPAMLGAILIAAVWVLLVHYPHDPDTWWHLVVGGHILKSGGWPTFDSYSFTVRGNPWIAEEWLGEVVMALAYRAGGLTGLALLRIAVGGALALLVYYYAWLKSRNAKSSFVAAALFVWLSYGFLWLRAQSMAYVLLAITLICLERFRQGRQKSLWILPPVFLLWINLHGSFVLGLFALAVYWLCGLKDFQLNGITATRWSDGQRRHMLLVAMASCLALFATPYGSVLAAQPFDILYFRPLHISAMAEWQPLSFGDPWGKQVLIFVLALILALVAFRRTFKLEDVVLVAVAFFGACVHRRLFVFFAIVSAPWVAAILKSWIPKYEPKLDKPVLNAALMAAATAAMVWFFPTAQSQARVTAQTFPLGAVAYLRAHSVSEPMFNEYQWGGYLIHAFDGRRPVFIDGRMDLYDYAGVFEDYIRMTALDPRTSDLLRQYHFRSMLVAKTDPLAAYLSSSPEWNCVYSGSQSRIFVREESDRAPIDAANHFSNRPDTVMGREAVAVSRLSR